MVKYSSMKIHKSLAFASIIVCIGIIAIITNCILQRDKMTVIEKAILSETPTDKDMEYKKYFGEHWKIAKEIVLKESGENDNAIGYNCRYNKKGEVYNYADMPAMERFKTKPKGFYSKACRKEDRSQAWSKDITKYQINVQIDENLIADEDGTKIAYYLWKQSGESFKRWGTCKMIANCK